MVERGGGGVKKGKRGRAGRERGERGDKRGRGERTNVKKAIINKQTSFALRFSQFFKLKPTVVLYNFDIYICRNVWAKAENLISGYNFLRSPYFEFC